MVSILPVLSDMKVYKLVRQLRDGSLSPLFINRKSRLTVGEWMDAEPHRTQGFKFRPGWHCTLLPSAPHLTKKGRVWVEVEVENFELVERPQNQGGTWVLAQRMKVIGLFG